MRSCVSVALADDGRMCTTANGIHVPVGVVVVHNMEEAPSAPRHPLNQSPSEVVECNRDLHYFIRGVTITCAEQHHL